MNKTYYIMVIVIIIVFVLSIYNYGASGSKQCTSDEDCVPFGSDGTCNCGCYNKGHAPWWETGACFCAAPRACACENNVCTSFYHPFMDCEHRQTEEEKEQCYSQVLPDIDDRDTCTKLPEKYRETCYDIVENK
jgi:hypothetical protein